VPDAALFQAIPHLDQYFGYWGMLPKVLFGMRSAAVGMNLPTHVAQFKAQGGPGGGGGPHPYSMQDGVAVFDLQGMMMKHLSSLAEGTSTAMLRQSVRLARRDPEVKAGMIFADTPGGTVAGTQDLTDDLAAFASEKPLYGYAEDRLASAGYYALTPCHQIYANASAWVGSIGTYGVVYDSSKAAEMAGVTVEVISAREMKGAGEPGTKITEEQRAEWLNMIRVMDSMFFAAVARGRRMTKSQVEKLADGRVHIAAKAVELGLIDGVQTFESAMDELRTKPAPARARGARATAGVDLEPKSQSTPIRSSNMPQPDATATDVVPTQDTPTPAAPTAPTAATFTELKAECVGADADFLVQQLETNATVPQARRAWMETQQARIEARDKKLADKATAAPTPAPGGKPVGDANAGQPPAQASGDAITRWNAAVQENMAKGMDKPKAVRSLVTGSPELYDEYIEQYNAENK